MGGENHGNGVANATSQGVHPPATAADVAAKQGSGNGNGGKGGGGGSFVKFTVTVRGRQWSSVRHVNESQTLEEFAAPIVRDARRLAISVHTDSIQRLQLEYSDGSETENLHLDATLGDVTICKTDEQLFAIVKQLLAIVDSTRLTPPPRMPRTGTRKQSPDSESTPQLKHAIASNCHDSVAAPGSSPNPLGKSWLHSSATMQNSLATRSGNGEGLDVELPNRGSEPVFPVHRRSKTRLQGVGTHYLKMSEISAHFHLTLVNAAEELGVSQTTLKNACRDFGLERWPGRKVRSSQRTMQGLLHESVVGHSGQGTGLEEMAEAYMWSEVRKLQQEMHQLVLGTPAQVTQRMHSPAVRSAGLYEGLYSPRGRSKFHSAGRRDMITLDTGNPTK